MLGVSSSKHGDSWTPDLLLRPVPPRIRPFFPEASLSGCQIGKTRVPWWTQTLE